MAGTLELFGETVTLRIAAISDAHLIFERCEVRVAQLCNQRHELRRTSTALRASVGFRNVRRVCQIDAIAQPSVIFAVGVVQVESWRYVIPCSVIENLVTANGNSVSYFSMN